MPKLKTRKSAAKRFKQTGTGKFVHYQAGRRHLNQKKTGKRRRHLRQDAPVRATEMARVLSSLPYGKA
jgi:large subunit ribosomal protein L35